MNYLRFLGTVGTDEELVASFGEAQLLRTRAGRFELRGGSADDRAEAREWVSLFLHEAVLNFGSHAARASSGTPG